MFSEMLTFDVIFLCFLHSFQSFMHQLVSLLVLVGVAAAIVLASSASLFLRPIQTTPNQVVPAWSLLAYAPAERQKKLAQPRQQNNICASKASCHSRVVATTTTRYLTLRAPRVTLVDKIFLPLSATGDFSRHKEQAAYRHVKDWPLSALVT